MTLDIHPTMTSTMTVSILFLDVTVSRLTLSESGITHSLGDPVR